MPATRPWIALALTAGALAVGPSGAAGPGPAPGATAQAYAIRVTVPGQPDVSTAVVSAPPDASSLADSFSAPGVAAGAIDAGAGVQSGATAVATASSDVAHLQLFGGEITADGASGRVKASAGPHGAAGDLSGSAVANLVVLGQQVQPAPNLKVPLGDWGTLTTLEQGSDTSAPTGAVGWHGFSTALDVHLAQDHGGLPAGSEILVGYAEAAAMTPPPTTSTAATTTLPAAPGAPLPTARPPGRGGGATAKGPAARRSRPPRVTPKLTAGGYVFPVYGPSSYIDTFGADRADIASGWHHGDDIFGQLGQPVLAVADGTVFAVGWNDVGGNRLWLRDGQGNEFYYAHLAAFTSLAVDGAQVRAGDVLGFLGNTGDAGTTPYHLHFEVHPVSLLYRGYDGAVDPTRYLDGWRKLQDVQFPAGGAWAPIPRGGANVPEPGAILLQVTDLSQAAGLDPASLRRAQVAQAAPG